MPEIEPALTNRLTGHAGLSALVGSRVYSAADVPQNPTYPYVSFQRIDTPRVTAMGSDPLLAYPRFQLNVMAKADNVSAAKNVALVMVQLRAALRRWRGTVAGTVVQDTFLVDENDIETPDAQVHGRALDILIWHAE